MAGAYVAGGSGGPLAGLPVATADIEVRGELPPLPLVATHAYRIAIEAITNAVRHADASTIEVVMRQDPPSVTVVDDGRGVAGGTRPDGHGLRTMRNRAETIGARLEWQHRERGRGTAVTLELPPTTPGRDQ